MLLTKLNGFKKYPFNLTKYAINWDRKVSAPQLHVKSILKPLWENNVVLEEALIPGSKLRIDLWNVSRGIVIEVSPKKTHTTFNEFFHKNRLNLLAAIKNDAKKRDWCLRNSLILIELDDEDIKKFSKEYAKEKFEVNL